jgi:hypothetical protein
MVKVYENNVITFRMKLYVNFFIKHESKIQYEELEFNIRWAKISASMTDIFYIKLCTTISEDLPTVTTTLCDFPHLLSTHTRI